MDNPMMVADNCSIQQLKSTVSAVMQPHAMTRSQVVYSKFKRLIDVLLSCFAIILLSPIMLIAVIAIRCDSHGPAIFKQKRVGRDSKLFWVFKFRTMCMEAPKNVATSQLKQADYFITKVGAFLRKTSIDELPQLFNVLRGEMSLIGPRPLVFSEREIHQKREEVGVYMLRPGLSGLAQVNGRDLVSVDEKVAMDLQYLQQFSLMNDIKIMIKTVVVVFSRKNYAEGSDIGEGATEEKSVVKTKTEKAM